MAFNSEKMAIEILSLILGKERLKELMTHLKLLIITQLEELAKRTDNKVDDAMVATIKEALL